MRRRKVDYEAAAGEECQLLKPDLADVEALEFHRDYKQRVRQKLEAEQAASEIRKNAKTSMKVSNR